MGIHLTIFGIANTIGAAAIPGATTNALNNIGTTATCTAQGFLIYVTFLTACSYYGSFSVYSYVGTLNNFETVANMEKYIHIVVHIYPICSGIYLITQQFFNNSGFGYCFLEVDPIGCGEGDDSFSDEDYVECVRGPDTQKESRLLQLFWIVWLYIEIIGPTLIMLALYFKVKSTQSNVQIPANEVVKQAFVYLLVMYAGVLPSMLVDTLEWSSQDLSIWAHLVSDIMFMLFGLFSMLTYLYFTTGDWLAPVDSQEDGDEDGDEEDSVQESSTDFIFEGLEKALKREGNGTGAIVNTPSSPKSTKGTNSRSNTQNGKKSNRSTSKKKRKSARFSFNIFDGTNASGQFADFIFEGDSSDFQFDMAETEKWNEVNQNTSTSTSKASIIKREENHI